MLSLYGMGLLIAGGFTGILIVVASGPQWLKDKFTSFLWEPGEDEI
ncbi:hypothetical protein [Bacillus sp. UNCCL81]|nr:hypothetical protein [Bacillus sp. UNCCL81]SFD44816.1 hypothetical protein SAMN02799633_03855 [Bacillus sp. UNCCL81]